MPRTARPDGLDKLLDTQFCVVSREQLLTLGMTDRAMQYRVRAGGPWQALARFDAWWPEAGVAAEVDSRQWHLRPADHERTTARHDLMGEAGIIPLHFLPSQIRREPAKVAQRIRGALAHGRMRPPLPIRTIPCPESEAARAVPDARQGPG